MHRSFSLEIIFLVILAILGEFLGNVFGLYRTLPAFDLVTHFGLHPVFGTHS